MPSRRIEKVNELIREEISRLLTRETKDPRLSGVISITEVDTSPDLQFAKIYVSILGSEEQRNTSLAVLQGASGFLRRELYERLSLRRTPQLTFALDNSMERGDRILRLLHQIDSGEVLPD